MNANSCFASLLGGFYLDCYNTRANFAKFGILLILFVSIATLFVEKWYEKLIVSCAVGVIIFSIKITARILFDTVDLKIHSDNSDDNITTSEEEELPIENTSEYHGISIALWNQRHVFDSGDINEAALNLICQGFDPDEVFLLAEMHKNGALPLENGENSSNQIDAVQSKSSFHFKCNRINKQKLALVLDKPSGIYEIITCTLMSVITVFCTSYICNNNHYIPWVTFTLITSLFSLVLSPESDPYSTSVNNKFIRYTRSFTLCLLVLFQRVLYFFEIKSNIFFWAACILPLLILFGLIGHPVSFVHWVLETVNMYCFGVCGSPSLIIAAFDLFFNTAHAVIAYFILRIENYNTALCLMLVYLTIAAQLDYYSITHLTRKTIAKFFAFIASAVIGALIGVFTVNETVYIFAPIIIFILTVALPYMCSYSQYIIFHGKILDLSAFVANTAPIVSFAFTIMYLTTANTSFRTDYCVLPSFCLIRLSMSVPSLGAFALVLASFTLHYELLVHDMIYCVCFGCIIAIKMVSIIRIMKEKRLTTPAECLYEQSALFAFWELICWILMSSFMFMTYSSNVTAYVYSFLFGQELKMKFGQQFLQFYSPPRPNIFYEEASLGSDEMFMTSGSEHEIEMPVYVSATKLLEKELNSFVQNWKFGLVYQDSFYLFKHEELIFIIHILSIRPHQVHFECRFLEYKAQTLCHSSESNTLLRFSNSEDRFGNVSNSLNFRRTAYEIKAKGHELTQLSMSQILVESVLLTVRNHVKQWQLLAATYIGITEEEAYSFIDLDREMHISHEDQKIISDIAGYFGKDKEYKPKLANSLYYLLSEILPESNLIDKLTDYFNDLPLSIDYEQFEQEMVAFHSAVRLFSVFCLMDSIGVAPEDLDDKEETLDFVDYCLEYQTFSSHADKIYDKVVASDKPVLMMTYNDKKSAFVHFTTAPIQWDVFKLETDVVRGLWSNEAETIIFDAEKISERASIQREDGILRNIINQSCNPPLGYPVLITKVLTVV